MFVKLLSLGSHDPLGFNNKAKAKHPRKKRKRKHKGAEISREMLHCFKLDYF